MITILKGLRVLLTGISGFIGSHVAARLVTEGAEVYGLDISNANFKSIENIKNNVKLYSTDLRNFASVREAVQDIRPQKVFHLAAYVDVSRSLEVMDEMVETNIRGTLNLLRALDGIDYDCFINTGTCEEYGDSPVPFREDQIPNPVSPYSASKVATTMFCQMLHKTRGLPITILRPFLTYGPGQENDMLIPSLIRNLIKGKSPEMTGGEQTREFNYVDDIVDGYIKAAVTPGAIGKIINIGNGREHRIKDVVELVAKLTDSRVKPKLGALDYRPGETWHFYCDNTRAKQILGWESRVSLEDGLKKTISWFREHYPREAAG